MWVGRGGAGENKWQWPTDFCLDTRISGRSLLRRTLMSLLNSFNYCYFPSCFTWIQELEFPLTVPEGRKTDRQTDRKETQQFLHRAGPPDSWRWSLYPFEGNHVLWVILGLHWSLRPDCQHLATLLIFVALLQCDGASSKTDNSPHTWWYGYSRGLSKAEGCMFKASPCNLDRVCLKKSKTKRGVELELSGRALTWVRSWVQASVCKQESSPEICWTQTWNKS